LEFHIGGSVSFCCPDWTKIGPIGNIKYNSLDEIWNSEVAQFIRSKIYSGNITDVCRKDLCPHLVSGNEKELNQLHRSNLPLSDFHIKEISSKKTRLKSKPTRINLANWNKCNLKCIMCSSWRHIYKYSKCKFLGLQIKDIKIKRNKDAMLSDKFYKELQNLFPHLDTLRLSGAGEPFVRNDSRKILLNKDDSTNYRIELATNGLLFTPKIWNKIKHNKFSCIDISIDAASKETYERIRRGGNWEILMENLYFISKLRKEEKIPRFILSFVVMKSNYTEIISFIKMGQQLNCDTIFFQKVRGDVCGEENIFELNNTSALTELKMIKKEAIRIIAKHIRVDFGNL